MSGPYTGSIVSFDTNPASPLAYVWLSKEFYVPWPTVFQFARITAETYLNLTLTLFADGVQYAVISVTSQTEFALPQQECQRYFSFQLSGTDVVDRVQIVEDISELT